MVEVSSQLWVYLENILLVKNYNTSESFHGQEILKLATDKAIIN